MCLVATQALLKLETGLSDKRCVEAGRFSLVSGSFEPAREGNRERV